MEPRPSRPCCAAPSESPAHPSTWPYASSPKSCRHATSSTQLLPAPAEKNDEFEPYEEPDEQPEREPLPSLPARPLNQATLGSAPRGSATGGWFTAVSPTQNALSPRPNAGRVEERRRPGSPGFCVAKAKSAQPCTRSDEHTASCEAEPHTAPAGQAAFTIHESVRRSDSSGDRCCARASEAAATALARARDGSPFGAERGELHLHRQSVARETNRPILKQFVGAFGAAPQVFRHICRARGAAHKHQVVSAQHAGRRAHCYVVQTDAPRVGAHARRFVALDEQVALPIGNPRTRQPVDQMSTILAGAAGHRLHGGRQKSDDVAHSFDHLFFRGGTDETRKRKTAFETASEYRPRAAQRTRLGHRRTLLFYPARSPQIVVAQNQTPKLKHTRATHAATHVSLKSVALARQHAQLANPHADRRTAAIRRRLGFVAHEWRRCADRRAVRARW